MPTTRLGSNPGGIETYCRLLVCPTSQSDRGPPRTGRGLSRRDRHRPGDADHVGWRPARAAGTLVKRRISNEHREGWSDRCQAFGRLSRCPSTQRSDSGSAPVAGPSSPTRAHQEARYAKAGEEDLNGPEGSCCRHDGRQSRCRRQTRSSASATTYAAVRIAASRTDPEAQGQEEQGCREARRSAQGVGGCERSGNMGAKSVKFQVNRSVVRDLGAAPGGIETYCRLLVCPTSRSAKRSGSASSGADSLQQSCDARRVLREWGHLPGGATRARRRR